MMNPVNSFPQGAPVTRRVALMGEQPGETGFRAFFAEARWWVQGDEVVLEISARGQTFTATASNLFFALMELRLNQLEPNQLILMANGSRYDVWATMTRDGFFPGTHGTVHGTGESVDLFETVQGPTKDSVVLVRDHLEFHKSHA